MDAMGAMQPIVRHIPVRDQQRRRQGDKNGGGAFEQALADQEQTADQATGSETPKMSERPVTPDLQNNSPDGRKDQQVRHIDVLA